MLPSVLYIIPRVVHKAACKKGQQGKGEAEKKGMKSRQCFSLGVILVVIVGFSFQQNRTRKKKEKINRELGKDGRKIPRNGKKERKTFRYSRGKVYI